MSILTTTYAPGTLTEQQIGEIWKAKAKVAGNRRGAPSLAPSNSGTKKADRAMVNGGFARIMNALKDGPKTPSEIAGLAGLAPVTTQQYLYDMRLKGLTEIEGGVGRSKIWRLVAK